MSELKALVTARIGANKSRHELAQKCGISVSSYQRYEAGQAAVPAHHRRIIAHELNLPKNQISAFFDPASKPKVTASKPKADRIGVILNSDIPETVKAKYRGQSPDWKSALASCNGDYVEARRKYPAAYNNFMTANTPKNRGAK